MRGRAGQPGALGVKAEERATSLTTLDIRHDAHMSVKMAAELPQGRRKHVHTM